MSYNLYEFTKEQYDSLDESMTEGDASMIMYEGRHLYMTEKSLIRTLYIR